jgi:hypothetical protein
MVEFEFKQTNQDVSPHYRPPTPAAGGSARPGSSVGATVRTDWAVPLVLARPGTSVRASGSPGALVVTPSGRALSPATEPALLLHGSP